MADHTPGPWMAAASPSSVVGWPVVASRGTVICSVSYIHKGDGFGGKEWERAAKEWVANANLIAAAPELLAELQQFVNGVETGMIESAADETLARICQRAKAAIAKARGQA